MATTTQTPRWSQYLNFKKKKEKDTLKCPSLSLYQFIYTNLF